MTNATRMQIAGADRITGIVDGFRRGHGELTGLELYYALERSTPLLQFHTMLRAGPQNRDGNGLQQSYGDHNRLLLLGLDKLLAGDLDWYCGRVDADNGVSDTGLVEMLDAARQLAFTRDALIALWLAGALHDCGILAGRGAANDVEDGVVIGRDVVEALCPEDLRGLTLFAIRHHDYIKDVFLGEVPAFTVAHELDTLDETLRPTALAALGLVQIAGAASLGVGRLTAFRARIFHGCLDGTALADQSRDTRLARLLAPSPERDIRPVCTDDVLDIDATRRGVLDRFLDCVPMHRWHRVFVETGRDQRLQTLLEICARWARSDAERVVVLGPDVGGPGRVDTALNGSRTLLIGA